MMDIIFIADTRRMDHRRMTQAAIDSCRASEKRMPMHFIVVDGNKDTMGFRNATTVTYDFDFNYNKCLNVGIEYAKYDFIALCNNDLVFRKDWAKNIKDAMLLGDYLSASPYDRGTRLIGCREGYRIGNELKGWCIVIRRKLLSVIGELATPVNFWFSDNVYAEQLKKYNIKHALCYDSKVYHLRSKTLMSSARKREYTTGQGLKFTEWRDSYNA